MATLKALLESLDTSVRLQAALAAGTYPDDEYIEVTSNRNRKKSKIDSHGHNITECIKMDTHDSENEYKLITPRPKNQRAVKEIHYGPQYHPLYDAIPSPEILEIPFPKTQRKDPTARKNLVVAPSRILEMD